MANYNSNKQENGGYFHQYVNFDQFFMQHNISGSTPFYSPSSPQTQSQAFNYSYPVYNNFNGSEQQNRFQPQPLAATNGNHVSSIDLVQNSNLIATATEFVPLKTPNSNLLASANVFVPKIKSNDGNTTSAEAESSRSSSSKSRMKNSLGGEGASSSSSWPNNRKNEAFTGGFSNKLEPSSSSNNRNGSSNENEAKVNTDAVADKLNKTNISDESSTLPSSGGAIKKVRNNRNERSDSKDRQSNGNRNVRNFEKRQADSRYEDRFDDRRRRNFRENDRYNNRASKYDKYDNNRNYRNKNENGDDSNSSTNGYRSNRNSRNDNNAPEAAAEIENTRNSKSRDKWHDKPHTRDRKRDDGKFNRNAKPKFDASNYSREIDMGKLECLVCCEMIKPFHSIWSCANCFHIMHLNYIIKWAASSKSDEGWRCCACQNISKSVPREYFCFCGKTKDPHYNRNDTAHSCGETCGRLDSCIHPCTQLCHPGPCPPCQAMVTRVCGCGKTSKIFQCNQKNDLKCDQHCEKALNCEKHHCEKSCHFGDCDTCDKEIEHNCYCKRDKRTVACTKENNEQLKYSCSRVCNKQLKCKNHKCKESCHPGECGDCKLLPDVVKTCPCGKMKLEKDQRKHCKDPIPLCTAVCKKPLTCGQPSNPHTCASKCHNGQCPPCNKQTSVKCRCGHMDQMIKCTELSTRADDARCKKRCTKKRNCGKHKCNQECCIDIDHECPMKCTYTLSCGKHKCESTCHKGRCIPCYRSSFDELYCECGTNVIYPPVPCGTKRPVCDKPCSRNHPFDHPVSHNCHSAQSCPPCMAFTTKYCHGKHEQRKIIPCSTDSFSCGLACNKPLKCGQHKCIKICHTDVCEAETDICKQNCTTSRVMCPHNCNAPCHKGTDCPETPCREMVEVLCQCGLRKQMRTCHDFSSDFRKIATASLASSDSESG